MAKLLALGKRVIPASVAAMPSLTHPQMTTTTTTTGPATASADPVLTSFRKSIDNIDAALIHMLAERFRITQAVGEYKAKCDLPASDPGREARQIERLRALAVDADLDPEFSEKFIRFVIDEVIRHHRKAAAGG
ncbi:MAG: hypothetical protein RLZZ08_1440 [Pseudomonadota bacterium]